MFFKKLLYQIVHVKNTFPHEFDAHATFSNMNKYMLTIRIYLTSYRSVIFANLLMNNFELELLKVFHLHTTVNKTETKLARSDKNCFLKDS